MRLSLIVAMSQNRVIGQAGKIPWRLPNDQKNFRAVTMGHTLIMGRKTHESIGRALDGRRNIVITHQSDYQAAGCEVVHSVNEALSICADAKEIFVIGGEAIYAAFLPQTDRIYLSLVEANVEGDTFFPGLNSDEWREVEHQSHAIDQAHTYAYRYSVLDRINL